jgi:uncharacterized membrane protein YhaH (DUF805 family)
MASEPSSVNPYATPRSAVAESGPQFEPVKLFSVSGRIGRARYITYGMGSYLLFGALGGLLSVAIGPFGVMLGVLAALLIVYTLTMQRCHDFDTTGWLALLVVVPLANLIFWFIPGTDGPNRFGKPTPPNGVLTLLLVWALPAVVVVGILAAVMIPAYQQHQQRGQQAQPR